MSVFFEYFAAVDDAAAAALIDWPCGPGIVPKLPFFRKPSPGYRVVNAPGIDPVVCLGQFEELLTGRSFGDQLDDPNSGREIAIRDGGKRLIFGISVDFIDALSAVGDDKLNELAGPWSGIEEFYGQADPALLASFLRQLRSLASTAKQNGELVYCSIIV